MTVVDDLIAEARPGFADLPPFARARIDQASSIVRDHLTEVGIDPTSRDVMVGILWGCRQSLDDREEAEALITVALDTLLQMGPA